MNPDRLGATLLDAGACRFVVWAPAAASAEVHVVAPADRVVPMTRDDRGYFRATADGLAPGARYLYRLDGKTERPDPASRSQPEGVHGPSEVVADDFPWTDAAWAGRSWQDSVFYELHVGAFTPEGTFDAIIRRLDELARLGITVVEIMPVAQFPGGRNWGYDGVFPFAVQDTYGGAAGLKRLVDACHGRGIAVALDVVYNHLGPEGNYLWAYGPYFTDRYRTPWGSALNFDGAGSDEVRRYFIENALQWVTDFHVDALRLDALHAIVDASARPFLEELSAAVHAEGARLGRGVHLIAEVDRNDPRFVSPPDRGGYGMDAQWNDDFHHSLRTLLTDDRTGYYADYGGLDQLARAFTEGYVYGGQYSRYRGRRHGRSSAALPASRFVVFAQNHDQVGNRLRGERLGALVPFEALKLAAGAVLLSPYAPLLFMGEEYGETAPFLYFVSHSDPGLIEAVRKGRREEFAKFAWSGEPPDPQDEATFRASRLDPALAETPRGRALRDFYAMLLRLRRERPALRERRRDRTSAAVYEAQRVLMVHRASPQEQVLALFNFAARAASVELPARGGRWTRVVDSSDAVWQGPGAVAPDALDLERPASCALAPHSVAVFARGPA